MKRSATIDWQSCGGILDIPAGWAVCEANFDTVEPYIKIVNDGTYEEQRLPVPKPLAYYLGVHFCGSDVMRNAYIRQGEVNIQNKIKSALGL